MTRFFALSIVLAAAAGVADAQPAGGAPPSPAPVDESKVDAKALLSSGLKLYAAKDYLGALAVFKDAYNRFPSAKILANIGTTLKQLGRNAEAANTYQKYIDAPDIDAAKKSDAAKILAELDAKLAILDITVTPDDAQVQVGSEEWMPAKDATHYRVNPGPVTIHFRKDGYEPATITIDSVNAGGHSPATITLAPVKVAEVAPAGPTPVTPTPTDTGIGVTVTPEEPPGKLGFFAYEHVDIQFKGAATFVGASYEVMPQLQAEGGGVLGPKFGAYVGARYAILPGKLRPVVALGMPVFFSGGARFGVRGAGGIEVIVHKHVAVAAEVGVEHVFNPEMNFASTTFIPALGAIVRL
jgi:hypothetical protein